MRGSNLNGSFTGIVALVTVDGTAGGVAGGAVSDPAEGIARGSEEGIVGGIAGSIVVAVGVELLVALERLLECALGSSDLLATSLTGSAAVKSVVGICLSCGSVKFCTYPAARFFGMAGLLLLRFPGVGGLACRVVAGSIDSSDDFDKCAKCVGKGMLWRAPGLIEVAWGVVIDLVGEEGLECDVSIGGESARNSSCSSKWLTTGGDSSPGLGVFS